MNSAIELCLSAPAAPQPCDSVAQWWPRHQAEALRWPRPIDTAIACGFAADRAAWAFASGYQASLRALLPDLPADRVAAFCVTEETGNRPKDIRTAIADDGAGGITLTGGKRWTTLGPESGMLIVAGTTAAEGRPAIRVARVPADAPGVRIEPMPPTRFVPEIEHAQVRLDGVRLPASALLEGDGYDRYVKPFRTIEDTHVTAAVLAYLVREARHQGWPRDWIARAAAVLAALERVADQPPADAAAHLVLAGALDLNRRLVAETDPWWSTDASDLAAQRWRRDVALFGVASTARELRAARAWERLSEPRAA